MAKVKIGKLPPRYSFILNPYADERLSKCPTCSMPTHLRKFALLIHIDEWGPMILGKTCRYCTPCELIIAHQDELEAQLAYSLHTIAPESVCTTFSVRCMHWRGAFTAYRFVVPRFDQTSDLADHVDVGGIGSCVMGGGAGR